MTTIQEIDFSVDVLRALLWQFNDAENLEGLLRRKQEFYSTNQRDFWQSWLVDVFDLRTANDFGLAVWASILDIQTYTENEASPDNYQAFGVATAGPDNNFNNANFATEPGSFNRLNTEQRRLLLQLRYYQLTTDGTVSDINRIFSNLFLNNDVYVLDNENMTISYVFTTIPDSQFLFVLREFDILPRPSGVESNILIIPFVPWGFGDYRTNFNNGNFFGS